MANPIAGWYPDPAGDKSKLRYWDGQAWTDRYMDRPADAATAQSQEAGTQASPQYAQPVQGQAGAQQQCVNPGTQGNPYNVQVNIVEPAPTTYQLSSEDTTLRLIAFIFAVISTVSCAIFILPLCWMVPMTVHCWGLYKGTKANTVGFGVCTLIFLSLVSGILLLISNKEQ